MGMLGVTGVVGAAGSASLDKLRTGFGKLRAGTARG